VPDPLPTISGKVSRTVSRIRQYVLPAALARVLLQEATSRRPAVVAVYLEAKNFASVTGELEGEVLRKGIDKQSDNDEITQEDVEALLDDWLEFYDTGLQRMLPSDPGRSRLACDLRGFHKRHRQHECLLGGDDQRGVIASRCSCSTIQSERGLKARASIHFSERRLCEAIIE
jgi:hypothetical protein